MFTSQLCKRLLSGSACLAVGLTTLVAPTASAATPTLSQEQALHPVTITVRSIEVFDDGDKGWPCGHMTISVAVNHVTVLHPYNGQGWDADTDQTYCSDVNYQMPTWYETGVNRTVLLAPEWSPLDLVPKVAEDDFLPSHTTFATGELYIGVPGAGTHRDVTIQVEGSHYGHVRMRFHLRISTS